MIFRKGIFNTFSVLLLEKADGNLEEILKCGGSLRIVVLSGGSEDDSVWNHMAIDDLSIHQAAASRELK